MKTIALLVSRIEHYFKDNKLIFILYVIGNLSVSITFIYLFGNTVTYMQNKKNNENYYRQYQVSFIESKEKIYLNDLFVQSLNTITDSFLVEDFTIEEVHDIENEIGYIEKANIIASYNNRVDIHTQAIKGLLTFDENSIQNSIIVPRDCNTVDSDETITIYNQKFNVIGYQSFSGLYFIPWALFEDLEIPIDRLNILVYSRMTDTTDEDNLLELLAKLFPQAYVRTPEIYILNDRSMSIEQIPILFIMYALSISSFLFLVKYMINRNKYELAIYSLTGATKKSVLFLLMTEIIVISSFINLIAIAIHMVFSKSLFERINMYKNISYSYSDYGLIFYLEILAIILASLPFLYSFYKKDIIESKNRSM